MAEDLESRIKALEEKLTPSPDKMSTMKASNRLKQMLDSKKGEKESQEDVVWRLNERAERVPELEKKIKDLEDEIENLNDAIAGMAAYERERAKEVSEGMYNDR